jgi:uncharacterized protein YkwD
MYKTIASLTVASCLLFAPCGHAQTLDAEQSAFLTLINNYRAQNGVGPLQVSVALQNSSQWMSTDMATKLYFSHTDSLGRDPFTRMSAFAYTHYPEGEIVAAGYSDAQNTFVQWQNACDPDASGACTYAHRLNMLYGSYKVLGIGRAYNASAPYRWYWTIDFGAFVDQTIGSPNPSAPTITSFTANPSAVTAGRASKLSWQVSGATSLAIDNGIGSVTGQTSISVAPGATTRYTLTASNSTGTATAPVTVTVNYTTPPPTPTGVSLWPTSAAPTMNLVAGGAIELGMKFRSDAAGEIAAIKFYKISANTGTHTGSLWTRDGTLLATGTFVNETASGWQTLTLSTPVAISANTTYIASYHTNSGTAAVGLDFQSRGQNNPPLHALQSGVDGYNGVYIFGAGRAFPVQGTNGYNFWLDVIFTQ